MWLGMGMALMTALLLVRLIRAEEELMAEKKAMLSALAIMTIFWMGNGNILLQPNESLQAYLVLGPLIVALITLFKLKEPNLRTAVLVGRMLLMMACGVIATFSFGAGVAVFPVLVTMAIIYKASWRSIAIVGLAAAVVCGLYLYTYPAKNGLSPNQILESGFYVRVCRWLGAPLAAMLGANLLTQSAPTFSWEWTTNNTLTYFSSCLAAIALVYIAGILALVLSGRQRLSRLSFMLLGIGLFVVCVGILIELAREKFQGIFPKDIFENRYFVWSSLFWFCVAGLTICEYQSNRVWTKFSTVVGGVFVTLIILNNPCWARSVWQPLRANNDLEAQWLSVGIEPKNDPYKSKIFLKHVPVGVLTHDADRMKELHIPVFDANSRSITGLFSREFQVDGTLPVEVLEKKQNLIDQEPCLLIGALLPGRKVFEILDQSGQIRGLLAPSAQYRGVLGTLMNRPSQISYTGVLANYQEGESYYFRVFNSQARSLQKEKDLMGIDLKWGKLRAEQ